MGYGADLIEEAEVGEFSSTELMDSAPTVTVTVLAEVTVTVAGPHSPAPDEAPIGELPVADGCPDPVSTALDSGTGTTVTVDGRTPDPVPIGEPVPVGPLIPVEFVKPKGAVELPMGPKLPPD